MELNPALNGLYNISLQPMVKVKKILVRKSPITKLADFDKSSVPREVLKLNKQCRPFNNKKDE